MVNLEFNLHPSNRLATLQYTNVRDRQIDRQDRQRSDIIGRTVLQTVSQILNLRQQKQTTKEQKALIKTDRKTYNKSSAVAEMGDRLATIDVGRKEGTGPLDPI